MSKKAKLIVQLMPLGSFELIIIYLKKCVQKGLKKCDYTICMDMNIMTLPIRGLNTRPYNMDMNKEDHITSMPKRGLKTKPYNMDMEKKDLKKLTKRQLIKLLMNQRKNEEVESVKKPTPPPRTGKWESIKPKPVLRKSVNEDIILPPPDGYKPIPKPRTNRPLQLPKIKELN